MLLGGLVAQFFGPWWMAGLVVWVEAAGRGLAPRRGALAGAAALGLLWTGGALYAYLSGGAVVAAKVARMVGMDQAFGLVAATGLVGILLGGAAGLAGGCFKQWIDWLLAGRRSDAGPVAEDAATKAYG